MTEFSAMPREELERRLRLAEDVCVMYGWTATVEGPDANDRDLAAAETWHRWARHVGQDYLGPDAHPELAGSESALARARRDTRQAVIRHFFGEEQQS